MELKVNHIEPNESDYPKEITDSMRESVSDINKTEEEESKMSPIPFLVVVIFVLILVIFSAFIKKTDIQDAFEWVATNHQTAKGWCEKVEQVENDTTEKYKFIITKGAYPITDLQWSCMAVKRNLEGTGSISWEITK